MADKANKGFFRKMLPYILAVAAFIVVAYAYAPYTLSGKVVNQSDISSWKGMSKEIVDWNQAHPDNPTYWTNSMFSGMPATTISVIYHGDITKYLYDALFLGQRPASYLIICMVGAFLMFLAFGCNIWLATLGAIAVAFCSYNMQIIQVGHNTKMVAIAFMPWVVASLVYAYRKNWLLGAALFGLALSFQIKANHPQITYYLAIIVLGFAIWQFCKALKEKNLVGFFKVSAAVLVAGLLGAAANINHLWPTYEYGQHTMRGGTELSDGADKGTDNSQTGVAKAGHKTRNGLDIEYATQWSYGIEETPNIFIPNFNGGASAGALTTSSKTYKMLTNQYNYPPLQANQAIQNLPLYWGPQAFTAGPMYMGAVLVFLAVLGLFVIKGGLKWWLAGVSALAIVLSWGYHFMGPTEFFFNYMPLYNKFRTVSMILIILQVTVPVLGILAIDRVLKSAYGTEEAENIPGKKQIRKALLWATAICGGFAGLFALIPSLAGSFTSAYDAQLPNDLAASIAQDRASLLRSDALRSLFFVLAAGILLILAYKKKLKTGRFCLAMIVLVLIDMWTIDKRYLSEKDFVTNQEFTSVLEKRDVDKYILENDKDPDYRVLDLTVDPFNNAYISYHHKTIGGYSPAKLQRYQDLIDRYIRKESSALLSALKGASTYDEAASAITYQPVLSMLNTRYIIISPDAAPLANPYAQGNCWFASNIVEADGADDEIAKLGTIDPRNQAVVSKDFIAENPGLKAASVANDFAYISLTSYAPNKLTYHYSSETPQAAIFSEVYYPGWKAVLKTVDGKETELKTYRANWILRGLLLPAGEGDITFTFLPESFIKGEKYSAIASTALVILLVAAVFLSCRKRQKLHN